VAQCTGYIMSKHSEGDAEEAKVYRYNLSRWRAQVRAVRARNLSLLHHTFAEQFTRKQSWAGRTR
jgi:hypothetical protein